MPKTALCWGAQRMPPQLLSDSVACVCLVLQTHLSYSLPEASTRQGSEQLASCTVVLFIGACCAAYVAAAACSVTTPAGYVLLGQARDLHSKQR